MNNLFAVGEIVVRQSENYPEANGEYKVLSFATYAEIKQEFGYNFHLARDSDIYYELEGFQVEITAHGSEEPLGKSSKHSSEKYLFKKHDGCGQDYNEMIKSLNVDIVEVV